MEYQDKHHIVLTKKILIYIPAYNCEEKIASVLTSSLHKALSLLQSDCAVISSLKK